MRTPRFLRHLQHIRMIIPSGGLGLALLLGFMLNHVNAAAPPSPEQQVQAVLGEDGRGYPSVVARVNSHSISGKALARRVRTVQQSQALGVDRTNPVQTALSQLINEEVLIQFADVQGIVVSDAEVRAFIQAQVAAQLQDPTAKQMLTAAAADWGLAPERYANDPRVIETYRQGMILGRVQAKLFQALPTGQREDPVAQQAAIQDFVARSGAQVERLITP